MTKADLYADGLSGRPDSAARRRALLRALGLPGSLSSARLLAVINTAIGRENYEKALWTLTETENPSC